MSMNKKKLLLIILCICTFIFAFNVYAEEDIFDSAADGSGNPRPGRISQICGADL